MANLPPATVVLIAVVDSQIHWMEPGADVPVDDVPSLIGMGVYGRGVHVEFADGVIWQLRRDVPVGMLTTFFTVDGTSSSDRDAVLRPYLIDEYKGHLYR